MDDPTVEAINIMILANQNLIERMWAFTLASMPEADANSQKQQMIQTAGKIDGYNGPPKDVAELQAWAGVLQNYTREIIARIEVGERQIRDQQ
jgi:hypothetical protein